MKSTFKLESIEIQGVKLNDMEFTQEYTATEAIQLIGYGKKFMQEVLEETPAMFESMEKAFNKFNEIDERINQKEKQAITEPKLPKELEMFLGMIGINPEDVRIVRG